jgi:hypothetical protein
MPEEKLVMHANKETASHTLCGKEIRMLPPGQSLSIPEPRGIADPNWITCTESTSKRFRAAHAQNCIGQWFSSNQSYMQRT